MLRNASILLVIAGLIAGCADLPRPPLIPLPSPDYTVRPPLIPLPPPQGYYHHHHRYPAYHRYRVAW
jgi:hypothetical protein